MPKNKKPKNKKNDANISKIAVFIVLPLVSKKEDFRAFLAL